MMNPIEWLQLDLPWLWNIASITTIGVVVVGLYRKWDIGSRLPYWIIGVVCYIAVLLVIPSIIWLQTPALIPAFSFFYRLMGAILIASWVMSLFFGVRDDNKWRLDLSFVLGIMMYATPDIMS